MLFIGLPIALCLAMLFYRYPLLLLSLFPVVNVVSIFAIDDVLVVGGFWLMPMDGVYFFTIVHLGLCALLQPTRMVQVFKENKFLSIFLAMVALYIVLYAPVYTAQRALGEARKAYFMFLIPLLASVAIKKPEDLRRFVLVLVYAAVAVAIFSLGRAAMRGSIVLAFNSEAALILTLVAFLMLVHRIYRIIVISPVADKILLCLFSVMALVSGQRSVWLAVGFGLVLMLWLYRSRSTVVTRMVVITAFAIFGLSAAVAIFPESGSRLLDRFGGMIDPHADANASWRIRLWEHHRDRLLEHGNFLFGEGLGGYYRDPRTGELMASPHNAYIQLVVKVGLFGLLIYSLVAFEFVRRALAVRKKLRPGPMRAYIEAGMLNFGAAHTFMLGYGFLPIVLMFFAVAASAVRLSRRQSAGYRATRSHYVPTSSRVSPALLPIERPLT